jgi:hypothetical protein
VRVVRDGGHGAMEADSRRLDAEEREPILSGRYLAESNSYQTYFIDTLGPPQTFARRD